MRVSRAGVRATHHDARGDVDGAGEPASGPVGQWA